MHEEEIWAESPSQWLNAGWFAVGLLGSVLVIPLLIALWKWLEVRCTRYVLTTQRLRIETGVLTRRVEEIELYRIKDTAYVEPFLLRLVGLGSVEIASSDPNTPFVELAALPDGQVVRESLRQHVESIRQRLRIRDIDFADMTGTAWSGE